MKIASTMLHMWEEPIISGTRGSGAIFFSGCNLRCVFCQNEKINSGNIGKEFSEEELAELMLRLEARGAHNINLVTAVHFTPSVVGALKIAKQNGLKIPVVYNSSGYESVESLKMYEGLIDVFMPDLKYVSPDLSEKYSLARDYFFVADKALKEMYREVGEFAFGGDGTLKRGMLVRHLVLPNCLDDSKAILKYLYDNFGDDIYVSIMKQYTPTAAVKNIAELNRPLSDEEYSEIVDFADNLGIKNAFVQSGEAVSESFIPDFEGKNYIENF